MRVHTDSIVPPPQHMREEAWGQSLPSRLRVTIGTMVVAPPADASFGSLKLNLADLASGKLTTSTWAHDDDTVF